MRKTTVDMLPIFHRGLESTFSSLLKAVKCCAWLTPRGYLSLSLIWLPRLAQFPGTRTHQHVPTPKAPTFPSLSLCLPAGHLQRDKVTKVTITSKCTIASKAPNRPAALATHTLDSAPPLWAPPPHPEASATCFLSSCCTHPRPAGHPSSQGCAVTEDFSDSQSRSSAPVRVQLVIPDGCPRGS